MDLTLIFRSSVLHNKDFINVRQVWETVDYISCLLWDHNTELVFYLRKRQKLDPVPVQWRAMKRVKFTRCCFVSTNVRADSLYTSKSCSSLVWCQIRSSNNRHTGEQSLMINHLRQASNSSVIVSVRIIPQWKNDTYIYFLIPFTSQHKYFHISLIKPQDYIPNQYW